MSKKTLNIARDKITFAYLRTSTDKQDIENQRTEIETYVMKLGLPKEIHWFEDDAVSGKLGWEKRKIKDVVEQCQEGDVVVVAEASRLGRKMGDIVALIGKFAEKKVQCHTTRQGFVFRGGAESQLIGAMFGYVAQIERELISSRTKEALRAKKAQGVKLGRPKGVGSSKLDKHLYDMIAWAKEGLPKTQIARKLDTSVGNLEHFLRKRELTLPKPPKREKKKKITNDNLASSSAQP